MKTKPLTIRIPVKLHDQIRHKRLSVKDPIIKLLREMAKPQDLIKLLPFDLDAIYKLYPRKLGKKRGMEICIKDIKNYEDYQNLLLAIKNYKDHIAINRVEDKYIKHFSTFMSCWKEWVHPHETAKQQMDREWIESHS